MTTGTVLAFILTGITVPVALVGGIWLEQRMPAPQQQRIRAPRHLRRAHPASPLAGGHRVDLRQSARGRHHR